MTTWPWKALLTALILISGGCQDNAAAITGLENTVDPAWGAHMVSPAAFNELMEMIDSPFTQYLVEGAGSDSASFSAVARGMTPISAFAELQKLVEAFSMQGTYAASWNPEGDADGETYQAALDLVLEQAKVLVDADVGRDAGPDDSPVG